MTTMNIFQWLFALDAEFAFGSLVVVNDRERIKPTEKKKNITETEMEIVFDDDYNINAVMSNTNKWPKHIATKRA